jgi:hypothetical protein
VTRWHLIPVGLSILDKRPAQARLLRTVAGFDPGELHRQLWPLPAGEVSAERASLHEVGYASGAEQMVVLCASDTTEGMLAGELNAAAIAPTYSKAGSATPMWWCQPSPIVMRVDQLDPLDDELFRAGMAHLAEVFARVALEVGDDDAVVVHLSGGYKATLPYLVVLTEILRAALGDRGHRGSFQAVIRWEHTQGRLAVPLRHIDLAGLHAELDGSLDRQHPLYGDGFLYEGNYRGPPPEDRLTALGRTVAAMIAALRPGAGR